MKNMKKLYFLGLTAALSLSLVACSGNNTEGGEPITAGGTTTTTTDDEGDTESTGSTKMTVESGKFIMATNAAFPPYEMVADDDGVAGTGYEGIDIEIAAAIAENLGLELVVEDMDFTAALLAPNSGKADVVMAGVTVNEERKANMEFTNTYATGVQVVIVTEHSPIETLDDLEGVQIGTQEGTTGYIYASDEFGDSNVTAVSNGAMAIESLLAGKVDCVIIDNEPAKSYVSNNYGLRILEAEFATEDYAIGVAKGNTELLDAINGALAELDKQGDIDDIVKKYINAD